MREIKFRAWDKANKGWVDLEQEVQFSDSAQGVIAYYQPDQSITVMLITGFADIDGREIYEGDIVDISGNKKKKNMPEVIGWDAERGRWCFAYPTGEPMRDINRADKEKWKVIGNIYENPELLAQTPRE